MQMQVLLCSALLFVSWVVAEDSCFKQSCYSLNPNPGTFRQAKMFCLSLGGKLAEIETSNEQEFISNWLRRKRIGDTWLGGSDFFKDGDFIWTSTGARLERAFWLPNEPSNDGGKEHCIAMRQRNVYKWAVDDCNESRAAICERTYLP